MAVPILGPSLASPSTPPMSLALDTDGTLPDFAEPYDYICNLCRTKLLDPMQTRCGHRLCKRCLEKHLSIQDPAMCPFDEEDCEIISLKQNDGSVYPDYFLLKELKKIKVYCPYKSNGCPQLVPWGKLKQHEESCEYGRVSCPNERLGCQVRPKRPLLDDHLRECLYLPLTCNYCQKQDIPQILMKEHIDNQCPVVEIECPYHCGTRFLRSKLEEHAAVCPNKPKECHYATAGCSFKGSEEDVQFHEDRDVKHHLTIVFSYAKGLEEKALIREKKYQEDEKKMQLLIKQMELSLKMHDQMLNKHEKLIKGTQEMAADHEDMLQENVQKLTSQNNQIATLEGSQQQRSTDVRRLQEHITTKLNHMDLRFQVLETASYNGTLLWKIRDYQRRKEEARGGGILSLYSQPFYTSRHGYKMCARVYLNGDGMGQGTHLSLFFVVMRGEYDALLKWPFRQRVSLMLLDQTSGSRHMVDTFRPDPSSSSFQKPVNDMNVASGCPLFVSHAVLEAPDSVYLKDDTIFIKILVDTTELPP